MNDLLKKILDAPGISGHEGEIAGIMAHELKKTCDEVKADNFGNVVGIKGKNGKKIMIAAHMDEVGLLVKYITKEGFLHFIKVGGIDDRILPGLKVIVCSAKGDVKGIIGAKPPHLQKDEDRKNTIKYEDMFIDIGASSKEDALSRVEIADQVVFVPDAGVLSGNLYYGKAADNRVGCYAMLKILEKCGAISGAQIFAAATAQEEVGLKGARISAFGIEPDFALILDTTVSGDTPNISEKETMLKLGEGVAVTLLEASGRGIIVGKSIRDLFMNTAKESNIKFQIDVVEGGMTDGAAVQLTRTGIPTGVLAVPCRYIHSPAAVFDKRDLDAMIELGVKIVEKVSKQ